MLTNRNPIVSSVRCRQEGTETEMKYKIVDVYGHYEVYINGNFYCSVDTYTEAIREIENYEKEAVTV